MNIFVNSKESKSFLPLRLSHTFTDKIGMQRGKKYVALLNLSIYYTWSNIKTHIEKKKSLKYQLQHGVT